MKSWDWIKSAKMVNEDLFITSKENYMVSLAWSSKYHQIHVTWLQNGLPLVENNMCLY